MPLWVPLTYPLVGPVNLGNSAPSFGFSNNGGAGLNYNTIANVGAVFSLVAGGSPKQVFVASTAEIQFGSGAIISFSSNSLAGNGASDLALARTAAGVMQVNSGTVGTLRWLTDAGRARVSTQFDKTDATLANVTGLSVALLSGRTYSFMAVLYTAEDATGGEKFAIAYSSTTSALRYQALANNAATGAIIAGGTATVSGTAVGASAAGETAATCTLTGTLTTTGAGNLTVQFAQNTANGTSSVLTGSFMLVWDIP
jgi:hypothetical protein